MTRDQELKLKEILINKGVNFFKIYRRDLCERPVIIFFDCLTDPNENRSSVAFSFSEYPNFFPQFWCSYPNISNSKSHEPYRTLEVNDLKGNDIKLYPFSMEMENQSLDSLLELINTIGENFE